MPSAWRRRLDVLAGADDHVLHLQQSPDFDAGDHMSDITPERVADELKHQLMPVSLAARPILLEAIAHLIAKHVAAERTRCRTLCEQRAELWRNTEGGGTSPLAREARSRANEATYIADLFDQAEALPGFAQNGAH
jgi:hypothetical protein